jgi:hypothetical protein
MVQFDETTRSGLRDKAGYDAFLQLLEHVETTHDPDDIRLFITWLVFRFVQLRETADIQLARLQRISLEQHGALVGSLLDIPSGGRFPVMIVIAALHALKDFFRADWRIEWQGINVADAASGVGGDITVRENGATVFIAEVTERPIERTRVVATFNAKIAPGGIEDYLFFIRPESLDDEAGRQARQYFAQGHEVNFIEVKQWVLMSLATIGARGRGLFHNHLIQLLDRADTPRTLKVAWNRAIALLTGGD